MKEYSIPMAVFDLLPVVFFIAGTMTIAGDMKHKMTLPARVLFEGGSWIAEGVNEVGQFAFLAGCHILHEAGLDKL